MDVIKNIAVIGGGAAGFFAAISVKTHHPLSNVTLFEKSSKVLSKVKISGGGRCNVTNANNDIATLCSAYPRGGKELKNIFYRFGPKDTREWFEDRGVALKSEPDGRVFPASNNSQSIIDCLIEECKKKTGNFPLLFSRIFKLFPIIPYSFLFAFPKLFPSFIF